MLITKTKPRKSVSIDRICASSPSCNTLLAVWRQYCQHPQPHSTCITLHVSGLTFPYLIIYETWSLKSHL